MILHKMDVPPGKIKCCNKPFMNTLNHPTFQQDAVFLNTTCCSIKRLSFLCPMSAGWKEKNVNAGRYPIVQHHSESLPNFHCSTTLQNNVNKQGYILQHNIL